MSGPDRPWDIDGPVQAEVFVVLLGSDGIALTGPCGPAAWMLEVDRSEHPLAVVERLTRTAIGTPLLVHSTSWRRDRDAVVLTFLVVITPEQVGTMEAVSVVRAVLARSAATAAPTTIAGAQVLEHALRHLAWLAAEDPAVGEVLSDGWKRALHAYIPEPFRVLETEGAR